MTLHERALELPTLAREDEQAASVLETAGMGDGPVFHYQQAVKRVLKALLAVRGVDFPKTHDLVRLLRLARADGYEVPVIEEDLAQLAPFAVTLLYEEVEAVKHLDRPQIKMPVSQPYVATTCSTRARYPAASSCSRNTAPCTSPVASSMAASKLRRGPRLSNQSCGLPSIWSSIPTRG
jgi:HEPN domain-containing protein